MAVTGPEAVKALNKQKLLESDIEKIKAKINKGSINFNNTNNISNIYDFFVATGDLTQKQMIKLITECGDDISAAQVSYWKKDELRNALKMLKKTIDDKEKTRKTAVINEVVESAKTLLNANPNLPFLVHEFKAFSENKALDGAFKQVKALSPSKYSTTNFLIYFHL